MRYLYSAALGYLLLLVSFAPCVLSAPACAVTVEPDVEAHRVVGTLYALSAAMNLYHAEPGAIPSPEQLGRSFQRDTLPAGWPDSVRVASYGGAWWVGVAVDPYSSARKFLRANAPELSILDAPGGAPWIGASFAWMEVLRMETLRLGASRAGKGSGVPAAEVAEGSGEDRNELFFRTPGTDRYWWSPLRFSDSARASVLKRWGRAADGSTLTVPQERAAAKEEFRASPVGLPEEFGVSSDREPGSSVELGDVIFNPIPRPRSN